MDPSIEATIRAAEDAVLQLVEVCRKRGILHNQHRKATAQVSRTAKWLLNAIAALNKDLDMPCTEGSNQAR